MSVLKLTGDRASGQAAGAIRRPGRSRTRRQRLTDDSWGPLADDGGNTAHWRRSVVDGKIGQYSDACLYEFDAKEGPRSETPARDWMCVEVRRL
jgi:hypothetical protein